MPRSSRSNGDDSSDLQPDPGGAGRQKHPLLIPLILDNLFQYCPVQVLASCRLVSRQWYQESLGPWRSNSSITFKQDNNGLILSTSNPRRRIPTTLQNFLDYWTDPWKDCGNKPYRILKMESCNFSPISIPEQFQQLWDTVGSHLTSLHLSLCTFTKADDDFRKIIFVACPTLQSLKVSKCTFTIANQMGQGSSSGFRNREPLFGRHPHLKKFELCPHPGGLWSPLPISWLEFFSHFPSLTDFSLTFSEEARKRREEFLRLTDAIRTVRQNNPTALPFKTFLLYPAPYIPMSRQEGEVIKELRLPCTQEFLRYHGRWWTQFGVKPALEYHSQTVRHLEISDYVCRYYTALTLPTERFPFGVELRLLEMGTGFHLVLRCSKEEMAGVRMLHLETLIMKCSMDDEDMADLFVWMPNLRSLDGLALNDKQFGMVCGNWRNLTSLVVHGYRLTDKGVTGVDNLRGGGKRRNGQPMMEPLRPNITSLQNLQHFGFWSRGLGDASVFHGLLQLPRLHSITFHCASRPSESTHHNPPWGRKAANAIKNRNIRVQVEEC